MSAIKANALVVKSKLKERGVYTVDKHPGLHLASRGDGTGSWRVKYRPPGSKVQRWYTVTNDAKNASFDSVLEAKDKFLADLKHQKVDPKAVLEEKAKVEAVAGITYDAAFTEWLDHPGRKRALSKRTREEYEGVHARHVKSRIGATPLTKLTRQSLEKSLRAIYDATNDPKSGQRGLQATKAYQNIRSVLEWAVDREYIPANPLRKVAWLPAKSNPAGKQSRAMTDAELRQLWKCAPAVMSAAEWRVLRLAILIGRRVSEIAGAERSDAHLDADPPYLFIPAGREGNKAKQDDAVPLPRLAREIIREALAAGEEGQPLFVGAATRWTASAALRDFRRDHDWPGQVRMHDSRTLINDHMARLGVPTELRSRTLHHTGDLRQLANTVYSSFDHMPERYRALRLWQARLINVVTGGRFRALRWHR